MLVIVIIIVIVYYGIIILIAAPQFMMERKFALNIDRTSINYKKNTLNPVEIWS